MSGRPRTSIGTFGEIRLVDLGGKDLAETRFRDLDGRLRKVRATAPSARAVRSLIKDRLAARVGYGSGGLLRLSSPFAELAELWLEDLRTRDIFEGTKENYRDDLRLHVRPFFASYTLGEFTTGRVKVFLTQELAISYSRAKHSKTLLSMLFAFARRHDAIPRNPLEGTSELTRPQNVVQALSLEQVQRIRAAATVWRTGPGVMGSRPDGTVRDVCDRERCSPCARSTSARPRRGWSPTSRAPWSNARRPGAIARTTPKLARRPGGSPCRSSPPR